MHTQHLHTAWTLRAISNLDNVPAPIRDKSIAATVPGCVHTDLIAAKLIDDPYIDRNELAAAWIGRTDWEYTTTFSADAELFKAERLDLVFDGLDTLARIELNGQFIASANDMHLPHRYDVKPRLKKGENTLRITFSSALNHAEALRDKMGALPHVEKHPFNFIRKMACNFGWDWGPTLITAGIWQPVYLHAWTKVRIRHVRPLVIEADRHRAVIDILVDVESDSVGEDRENFGATALLFHPNGAKAAYAFRSLPLDSDTVLISMTVDNPKLWWPRGHGEQPLYSLLVEAGPKEAPKSGEAWRGRVGMRTVRLNTNPDEIGTKFTLEVNGKPIFCKGANWIPDDCFPHRVTEARYRERIQQGVAANMNMLRIWGGGIYETKTFYSICDELGVMVWQDFLFACAAYPEEAPFSTLVEAEARHHVARLSSHASLVLWNGCNENVWGYFDWGWKEKIGSRTWGKGFYLDLLPRVVEEVDPTRPYWPASPYSGTMDIAPLDDRHGNKHVWDAWNQKDYTVYRQYTPRFVSEFGHQAPPTYATIRHSIPDNALSADSPSMLHHQKATDGNKKLNDRLGEHFNAPANFDDWLYLTQLNQARALATGVEWYRSRAPVCMGALYWQINDCWPVTSWAAIDGEGRLKPLWYATRRFFTDRLVTIQPEADGTLVVHAINDSDIPWVADLVIRRMSFDGTLLATEREPIGVAARDRYRHRLDTSIARTERPASEFIVADVESSRGLWFFEIDKQLHYPAPHVTAELKVDGGLHRLRVTAKTLLRDACVFADRLDPDARVNDQLVTLLPGETFTFVIESKRTLTKQALLDAPVFQSANRFGIERST